MNTTPAVPDALAALIAAVIEANPFAPPRRQGQLVLSEMRALGWHVGAPGTCRPTGSGAEWPSAPYQPVEV